MKIASAAIRLRGGRVVEGGNHREIRGTIAEPWGSMPPGYREGFTTDAGIFVGRHEAAKIARAAGQLWDGTLSHPKDGLHSSDVRFAHPPVEDRGHQEFL